MTKASFGLIATIVSLGIVDMPEQTRREEAAVIELDVNEVRALLFGVPKDEFATTVRRLSSWLEKNEQQHPTSSQSEA